MKNKIIKFILLLLLFLVLGCSLHSKTIYPHLELNRANCQLTYINKIEKENYKLSHTVPKNITGSELCIFQPNGFPDMFCITPYAKNLCIFVMSYKDIGEFTCSNDWYN